MDAKIWLSSPHMSEEGYEKAYVKEAFDTNWIAPLGNNVDEFERELAEKVGIGHAAALSSGTAALHLALKAANIQAGDIVFCQSLTFSASANPIIYENAIPVFIDSEPDTWNMCPKALAEAFKKYPQAKAVIVVNLYGISAKLDEIATLCKGYQAVLIEDAAESLGGQFKGQATGTFGDYGVYSFNGNKIITTSGGGALVSNDEEKIKKARFWATQSRDAAPHYQHSEIGYNYRMSNVSAGIGRGQLKVLEERVAKKKYIFEFYQRELSHLNGLNFMPIPAEDSPNYWLTCITIQGKVSPMEVIKALQEEGIEARPLWKPMHLQPVFEQCDFIGGTVAQNLFENGLCLPSDTKMTDTELSRVCSFIKKIWIQKQVEVIVTKLELEERLETIERLLKEREG